MGQEQSVILEDFKPFPIVLTAKGRDVMVTMPFPRHYPKTPLLLKIRHDRGFESFIHIHMTVRQQEIFVHGFYVFANVLPLFADESEKRLFKGVGKRALCAAVSFIARNFSDIPSVIRLEASGGNCSNYSSDDIARIIQNVDVEKFRQDYRRTIRRQAISKIASIQSKMTEDEDDLIELNRQRRRLKNAERLVLGADEICETIENRKLIRYYKTALGFTIVDDRFDHALMEAPVSRFLQKCNE